eukprot:scaffold319262_cov31-Tisochrysis_lutea.AAC.3
MSELLSRSNDGVACLTMPWRRKKSRLRHGLRQTIAMSSQLVRKMLVICSISLVYASRDRKSPAAAAASRADRSKGSNCGHALGKHNLVAASTSRQSGRAFRHDLSAFEAVMSVANLPRAWVSIACRESSTLLPCCRSCAYKFAAAMNLAREALPDSPALAARAWPHFQSASATLTSFSSRSCHIWRSLYEKADSGPLAPCSCGNAPSPLLVPVLRVHPSSQASHARLSGSNP